MQLPHIYNRNAQPEFYTPERCHIIEIFNKAQCPELSIAQARVEPGVTTANHALAGGIECFYILQGEGEMYLNGAATGRVSPGDLVYIPADMPQYIYNTGAEDLVFLCICTPAFRAENYRDLEESGY
jgi:mannose-6-phosphate isomerase-like protein (cupin superfamily)